MSAVLDFDLRGKDWLTEAEAAHYCGVSLSHFKANAGRFRPKRFLGRKLYSRAVLFDAIQGAEPWLRSTSEANVGISTGARTASSTAVRLAESMPPRLRRYVEKRKLA